jgi:DNA-binding transcriptional regulator LsrR (DeoR family)
MNFQLFDKNGRFLSENETLTADERNAVQLYNSKFFSLSPQDFIDISKGTQDLIIVAGGIEKREAIVAAIKGNLVRILITDLDTAIWLSDYELEKDS